MMLIFPPEVGWGGTTEQLMGTGTGLPGSFFFLSCPCTRLIETVQLLSIMLITEQTDGSRSV